MQLVERWILAALPQRTVFSLAELNAALPELLERLNRRPLRKLPGSSREGRHTAVPKHVPKAYCAYAEWTPQRLVRWAEQTGPATAGMIGQILVTRAHPQQGFRSC